MKEVLKDFIVGFVTVILCTGLIAFFCIKPVILFELGLLAILVGLLYLCYIIGEKIRESYFYENLVWYMKRMLNKGKKKGV